jgi:hypothetical protein
MRTADDDQGRVLRGRDLQHAGAELQRTWGQWSGLVSLTICVTGFNVTSVVEHGRVLVQALVEEVYRGDLDVVHCGTGVSNILLLTHPFGAVGRVKKVTLSSLLTP